MTRLRVVGLASVVLLVSLLAWGYHWWTNPSLLEGGGTSSFEFAPRPLTSGPSHSALSFPIDDGLDETIVLSSVTAHLGTNTARATASFAICQPAGDRLEAGHGDALRASCTRVRPIKDGTRLRLSGRHSAEYVVMTLTSTRPGKVVVDSVTIAYTRSWKHLHQHGEETLGGGLVDQVR